MLVQEVRRKSQVRGPPVISRTAQGALLAEICGRSTIRHPVLHISIDAHIVVSGEGSPEHKVLPVGRRSSGQFLDPVTRSSAFRIYFRIELLQL